MKDFKLFSYFHSAVVRSKSFVHFVTAAVFVYSDVSSDNELKLLMFISVKSLLLVVNGVTWYHKQACRKRVHKSRWKELERVRLKVALVNMCEILW